MAHCVTTHFYIQSTICVYIYDSSPIIYFKAFLKQFQNVCSCIRIVRPSFCYRRNSWAALGGLLCINSDYPDRNKCSYSSWLNTRRAVWWHTHCLPVAVVMLRGKCDWTNKTECVTGTVCDDSGICSKCNLAALIKWYILYYIILYYIYIYYYIIIYVIIIRF